MIILDKLQQLLNALSAISVTEMGITTSVNPVQFIKQLIGIKVILLERVTLLRLKQPEKIHIPIEVTEFGIVIVSRFSQPPKAF